MAARLPAAVLLLLALCTAPALGRKLHAGSSSADKGPCDPHQLHLSLTGNPTEMRVSWRTRGGSCPSAITSGPAEALTQNPMDPTQLSTHHGSQRSYSSADMCAPPARRFDFGPTYLHTAVLTGLKPQQRYFYQVEGGRPVEFTAPVPAGPRHSFRFLVFGDMGDGEHRAAKSPGASRTVELLTEEQRGGAELVMHIGDISYANGKEEIWDAFMESIEPFAQHIPYHVAVGNHEYDYEGAATGVGEGKEERAEKDPSGESGGFHPQWGNFGNDSGGECGVQTSKRFVMPDVADLGYWSRNLSSAAAAAEAAAAQAGSNGDDGGSGSGNPTLGPDAAAFLQRVAARAEAEQEQRAAGAVAGGELPPAANRAAPAPNAPFWYSFSHGSVHFVVLSTEHDLQPGSRQHRWLELDLQRVDRCLTPWVVVNMHRPMYVVYPHKSNRVVGDHLRAQLEGLLNRYQADLVISGHVHSYSRTCNVLDEKCVPADEGGMTHIIVGCAGRKLTDVSHGQEEWLEFAAVRFGYGRVTVNSGESLLFELVGEDGRVYDSVKLHNSRANLRGCSDGYPAGDERRDECPSGICPPWQQQQQQQQQQQPKGGLRQAGLHASAA